MASNEQFPTNDALTRLRRRPTDSAESNVEPAVCDPDDLTQVAGTVGKLIDWMAAGAIYPNRKLYIGAALVTVGTLIGHRVADPINRSGTHLYVVAVAPSGVGKAHPMNRLKTALKAAGAEMLIGPGDYRSSVAIIDTIKERPLVVSALDEYGDILQRILHAGAGGWETDIISTFKQLWGLSYEPYTSPASANKKFEIIFAPALSIFGASVPETFYGALKNKEVVGGFLSRHLIIDAGGRGALQKPGADLWRVPEDLAAALRRLYRPRSAEEILNVKFDEVGEIHPSLVMRWGPGAEAIFDELSALAVEGTNTMRQTVFTRTAEKAVRVATIVAAGRGSTIIEKTDMAWASRLVVQGDETLFDGVVKYSTEMLGFAELCSHILARVKDAGGRVYRSAGVKGCRNYIRRGGDIDGAVKHLEESGQLRRFYETTSGRPAEVWELIE